MKNKIFEINVDFETKSAVDTDLIKIVKGDYNSIEFDLKMDKTDYKRAVLFLVKPSKKNFVVDIANSKAIFTEKNTFDEVGIYYYGIVLYGTNSKLTTSTKGKIQVVEGYNEDNEDITGDDNYPILDKLIEEVTDLKDKINASLGVMNKTFKEVTYDPTTGVMSFKNLNNEVTNINLPLSLLISSASYDNDNKKIVLTLANNDTIDIPVLDLVSNYYDDKINANKEYIASTSNELYRLKTDVLETGESSGNNIHLEDSALSEIQEISVDGVCEQKATMGKNKFNPNWFTFGVNNGITATLEDDHILLNGTSTNTAYFNFNIPNAISDLVSLYWLFKTDNVNVNSLQVQRNGGNVVNINTSTTNWHRQTISNSVDYKYTGYLRIASGVTLSNCKVYIDIYEENIDINNFIHEAYTGGQPSPSPDYPQEIKTITDSLSVTSCNKNLLALPNETIISNGVTSTIKNNELTIKGTCTQNWLKISENLNLHLKAGTYTLSRTTKDAYRYNLGVTLASGTNKIIYGSTEYNTTFTIDEDFIINTLVSDTNIVGTSFDFKDYVQLEQGSQATSFEEHLQSKIIANLPEGEFIGKINDTYKDTLNVVYKEDGHYHLILNKMIGKVVLDGSENWIENPTYKGIFMLTKSDIVQKYNNVYVQSNYFLGVSNDNFSSNISTIDNSITNYGNTRLFIAFRKYQNNLSDFKSWLSTHNTEVYYALETPYEVDLGIVDTLLSYDKITNIFSDSDLYPVINAKYYRNFITTIQNLQINNDTLKNELVSIESRLSALENANTNVVDNNPTDESEVTE